MTPIVKNSITLVGLVIVAVLGYYLFVINGSSELSNAGDVSINDASLASEQYIRELKRIEAFDLSGDIFEDPRFRSFVDFSKPVQPLPVGRENPFAPVE